MNCQSCEIEIPPQWKSCLSTNICPACGGKIMDEAMQELIAGISEAIKTMGNSPEGIACWVVSNYKLSKIAEYKPTEIKKTKKDKPVTISTEQIDKQNRLEMFFKNAGINMGELSEKTGKQIPNQVKAPQMSSEEIIEEYTEDNSGNDDETDYMIANGGNGGSTSLSDVEKSIIQQSISGNNETNEPTNAYFQRLEMEKQMRANSNGAISKSGKPAGFRRA